jgi:asparagine synthase (glutamine-hydrolysing)
VCGIAGVYEHDPRTPVAPAAIRQMVDAIRHRGPDDDGFFFADGVGLGMCRLAIIDVAGGTQPLCDESGDVVVIQNGEIYNYRELRADLEAAGHRFVTASDTEVIAHLYEDRGAAFPQALNGMFAIALFDRKRRRLVLSRDRLGKKPLFVRVDAAGVLFGSEMKSLLGSDRVKTTVDLAALHDYLSFNFVPGPGTIFSGIRQVAPGATLVAEDGGVSERPYWELRAGPARPWTDAGRAELRALFLDAVALRLRADVPVGLYLSGGVDSSAVAWAVAAAEHGPTDAFAIGFDGPEFDETAGATEVARSLGLPLHVMRAGDELLSTLPEVIHHAEQPHGDASFLPMLALARAASRSLKVVLTGEGADETLGGYGWHAAAPYNTRDPWAVVRDRFESHAVFRHDEKLALERGALRQAGGERDSAEVVRAQLERARDADPLSQTLFVDTALLLPGNNLVKADRMGMACGLELRCPFLDHRMVELAFSIPGDERIAGGITKRPLREMLASELPVAAARPKRMFGVPLREWFRSSDHPLLRLLTAERPERLDEWIDPRAVDGLLAEHRSGGADHTRKLRALLALAVWTREFGARTDPIA